MYKLPNPPSPRADTHELADFIEISALEEGATSLREIASELGKLDENEYNIGCDDDADIIADSLDEVTAEMERRATACNSGYPFTLEREGTVARFEKHDADPRSIVYLYLLLSTRLNMLTDKVQAGIDGTQLLEQLTAHVLSRYLGPQRSRSICFGTSVAGTFEEKINKLCSHLGEGGGFVRRDPSPPVARDAKLDAVAWVPFSDCKPGQLSIFAQAKTGTSWESQLSQLQPDVFRFWMKDPFVITPLRAFCVSEAANRGRWLESSFSAGLFFDRCRLVDFSEDLPSSLMTQMKNWAETVIQNHLVAGR